MDDLILLVKKLKKQFHQKFIKRNYYKNHQSRRKILNFLETLVTAGLPLMKSVLKPLAKSVLIPLGLTTAASATDEAIQKTLMNQVQQNK